MQSHACAQGYTCVEARASYITLVGTCSAVRRGVVLCCVVRCCAALRCVVPCCAVLWVRTGCKHQLGTDIGAYPHTTPHAFTGSANIKCDMRTRFVQVRSMCGMVMPACCLHNQTRRDCAKSAWWVACVVGVATHCAVYGSSVRYDSARSVNFPHELAGLIHTTSVTRSEAAERPCQARVRPIVLHVREVQRAALRQDLVHRVLRVGTNGQGV